MGVVISSNSELAPISVASIIIGFASFAFTLATFFKVVWVNLETMSQSSNSVHTYLNTLREEMLDEQASLRVLKKINRHRRRTRRRLPDSLRDLSGVELDEVTLKTLSDTMRHVCREFKELEKPFLQAGEEGIQQAKRRDKARRRRTATSPSSQYGESAYEKRERSEERAGRWDEDEDDDLFWAQRVHYGRYNLARRLIWLYKKSKAEDLYEVLNKMQTRRIARQINTVTLLIREYGDHTIDYGETLQRIDDRLSRVVGVRRID